MTLTSPGSECPNRSKLLRQSAVVVKPNFKEDFEQWIFG
jgi:hypothetical protein